MNREQMITHLTLLGWEFVSDILTPPGEPMFYMLVHRELRRACWCYVDDDTNCLAVAMQNLGDITWREGTLSSEDFSDQYLGMLSAYIVKQDLEIRP